MTVSFGRVYAFNYFINVIVSKGDLVKDLFVRVSQLVGSTLAFLISER